MHPRENRPVPQSLRPSPPKPRTPAPLTATHRHLTGTAWGARTLKLKRFVHFHSETLYATRLLNSDNYSIVFVGQHFVSEWVGDKQQDRSAVRTPEPVPERPLRISSDPEVLATQLNALPGLACTPQVYSTPKHYVRFSSPFLANRSPTTPGVPTGRRRSRELPETPPTTGSCKKVRCPAAQPNLYFISRV